METPVDPITSVPPVEPTATGTPPEPKKPAPRPVLGQTNSPYGMGYIDFNKVTNPNITTGPTENQNIHLELAYTDPPVLLNERKDLKGTRPLMAFLSERGDSVDERIHTFVNPKVLQTGAGLDWNRGIVAAASSTAFIDNRFNATINRPDALFRQYLASESRPVGFTAPKPLEAGVGVALTGERAMQRVRGILGLAGQVSIPMYHSGFWITLQAPKDSDVIELQRRVQEEKIELGRETYGLVFSNEQAYINSFLLDFCLEHIHSHTVRVDNPQDLKKLIKIQDLNILFWGMACLIWPRGFDYVRSVMTQEGIEATEMVSGKIAIGKLLWVDNASFDVKQAAHLANNTQQYQMTIDTVLEYQKNFMPSIAGGRLITIRDNLQLLINSTNASNYIADGAAWISGIVQTVDSTFTQSIPDEESRNRMIDTHARASSLRNYASWISALVIDGQENYNRDDINDTLTLLSTEPESVELIMKEVPKFIDDCTRALVAIPETSGVSRESLKFPNLIPIDVINTFFTLLGQHVNIIASR